MVRFIWGVVLVLTLAVMVPASFPRVVAAAASQEMARPVEVLSLDRAELAPSSPDPVTIRRGLVLGFVAASEGANPVADSAERIGRYLQERLAVSVKTRGFVSEEQLFNWLYRYQEVDVAWLSREQLQLVRPGELFPLISASPLPYGELIAHQQVGPALRQQLTDTLVGMEQSAEGRDLLAMLGVSRFGDAPVGQASDRSVPSVASAVVSAPTPVDYSAYPVPKRSVAVAPTTGGAATASPMAITPTFTVAPRGRGAVALEQAAPVARAEAANQPPAAPPVVPAPVAVSPPSLPVISPQEPAVAVEPALQPVPTTVEPVQVVVAPVPVSVVPPVATQTPPTAPDVASAPPVASPVAAVTSPESTAAETQSTTGETPVTQVEPQGLATLYGAPEVALLPGVDALFLKHLSTNQVFPEEQILEKGETDLAGSISAGRNFNRESHAALARSEQATEQTGQAMALLMPNASARVSVGQETSWPSVRNDPVTGELVPKSAHSRTDAAVVVTQPLFDMESYLEWRRREVLEMARGEDFRVSDGDAYVASVDAYLALVSSRLQTNVTRDFEGRLAELFTYIQKRAAAGASSVSDMARVDARRVETESFRLEQEAAHTAAWLEFVRLTNVAPQTVRLPVPEDVGAAALPQSLEAAVATAMQHNPEIASLRAELQAAKIDESASVGRFLPRIDAEYSYNYTLHAGGDQDPDGQRDERIMAVLNWDLFSSGRDYHYRRDRQAKIKELQYLLDDQCRRTVEALSANYTALVTTRERIASGYRELKAITVAADAMSKRMLSGNQSLLDLLDVYDRFFRVRSRLVNLHSSEMNTVAQLVRLTRGTPWDGAVTTASVQ